jgi:hypothetical protein
MRSQITYFVVVVALIACQHPQAGAADSSGAGAPPGDSAAPRTAANTTPTPDTTPAPASPTVTLTTAKQQYRPGETITLALTNHSGATYSFNPCTRTMEHRDGSRWTSVNEGQRMCTMEAWLLSPHASRSAKTELPAGLSAGTYRVILSLTANERRSPAQHVTATSAPFTVAP